MLIEHKFIPSLSLICLSLPILRESSLNLLSSLFPLFLNREIFEKDPFAMFSFLSVSAIVTAINQNQNPFMSTKTDEILIFPLKNSFVLLFSLFSTISGLIFGNFLVLKLVAVHFIGCFIFNQNLNLSDSIYLPFLSLAFTLSFAQLSTRKPLIIHPKLESITIQLISVVFALLFAFNCFKSFELSPAGHAALQLNDLLLSESISCNGNIKAHISKTAQSLGFSKFSTIKHPKISYEFGTLYDEQEMLQKFKYRVADINENVNPAYWRTRRVFKGIKDIQENETKLQVKLLTRAQADVS